MVARPINLRSVLLASAVCLAATPAFALTLTYKGENKWVAPEDNKPLRALMAQAKDGQTHFKVGLPAQGRALAVQRLVILRNILEREAALPVVLEETGASAKANTLEIR